MSLLQVDLDEVLRLVDESFEEQMRFLADLVAARSDIEMLPTHGYVEEKAALVVQRQLSAWEMKPELVEAVTGRPNVVCRMGPVRARKSLWWHAHLDTNPWRRKTTAQDSLSFVRGERMYGPGIWDMKASISAFVFAMGIMKKMGIKLTGRLLVTFAADGIEGSGSKIGIRHLMQKGIRAKAGVLGSPGASVGIGHRGGYRFEVVTKGEAVHTGSFVWQQKERGKNAIVGMGKVIQALSAMEVPYKPAKAFPQKKPVFTFPTMIEGGEGVNVVPAHCKAIGDVRLMPGNSHKQVRMRIEEKLDEIEGLDYELNDLLYVPAAEVDHKEEVVETFVKAYEKVSGTKPEVEGIGPWNNGWVFAQRDIPLVFQVPLNGGMSRFGVEWVSLPELKQLTAALVMSGVEYLGGK